MSSCHDINVTLNLHKVHKLIFHFWWAKYCLSKFLSLHLKHTFQVIKSKLCFQTHTHRHTHTNTHIHSMGWFSRWMENLLEPNTKFDQFLLFKFDDSALQESYLSCKPALTKLWRNLERFQITLSKYFW
jgi:hypothetical protein